jgi:uncharacterized metal-binding protein YceD (DUF177 family)
MDGDLAAVFTRKIRVSLITGAPVARDVTADAAECARLAALFGLPAIGRLSGAFVLTLERGGVIAARLRLFARVTQVCVVSLEEFPAEIREESDLRFVPAAKVKEGAEVELDPETLDGPDEIFYGGEFLDLGAVLAEQLALALDPYPKKPGAVLAVEEDGADEANKHPFAALRKLRRD